MIHRTLIILLALAAPIHAADETEKLKAENARLKAEVAALKEEIQRLKDSIARLSGQVVEDNREGFKDFTALIDYMKESLPSNPKAKDDYTPVIRQKMEARAKSIVGKVITLNVIVKDVSANERGVALNITCKDGRIINSVDAYQSQGFVNRFGVNWTFGSSMCYFDSSFNKDFEKTKPGDSFIIKGVITQIDIKTAYNWESYTAKRETGWAHSFQMKVTKCTIVKK